jgi:hypothetical protein
MKQTFIFASALLITATIVSCTKTDSEPVVDKTNNGTFKVFTEGKVTTVQNLPGDTILGMSAMGQPYGSGKFTFFSISNKSLVMNSDSASTKWDIGIRGTTIITNAGSSGPGTGGAFVYVGTFDGLSAVPADSTFRVDAAPTYAITTGSGKGWYNYDGVSALITPLPGRVMVIRTATGKYAKLEILNYYKGGVTPSSTASDNEKMFNQRHVTFRFSYQADGTKNF